MTTYSREVANFNDEGAGKLGGENFRCGAHSGRQLMSVPCRVGEFNGAICESRFYVFVLYLLDFLMGKYHCNLLSPTLLKYSSYLFIPPDDVVGFV